MNYHLRTLGRLSLHRASADAQPVLRDSKSLAVLAYVVAAPGREARRSHLADLLWPHSDRSRARSSLRQALYYLSKKAEDGLVLSDDGVVTPNPRKLDVDLWRFDRALQEDDWEQAVELYEGPFLGGFSVEGAREFEGWSEAQNEAIWSGLKAAYYRLVESASEAGEVEKAVRHAREYVELNPLDETAQRTLIRAQIEAGDTVGAYRSYERYRSLLREELDAEPGEELEARIGELRDRLFRVPSVERPEGDAEGQGAAPTPDAGDDAAVADPGPEGDGGDGAGGPQRSAGSAVAVRPRVVGAWVAAGAALGAVLGGALVTVFGTGTPTAGGGGAQWGAAEGRLLAYTAGGEVRKLDVRDGRARVEATSRDHKSYLSPDGRRRLVHRKTPDGVDVAVEDARTGETKRVVAGESADEVPLGWGPEGRLALYWRGERLDGDRAFARHLRIVDTETGRLRRVEGVPELGKPQQAVWSPLGPWIAFRGQDSVAGADIYLIQADGSGLRRLTPDAGEERDPSWSPSGDRIAYVARDDGDGDLHVIRVDGDDMEPVTHGSADDRQPVWLSRRHLAFVSDRSGPSDVWLLDLQTRRLRRLTDEGDYRRLRALDVPARTGPVERVRIAPRPDTVSPGQRLRLAAEAWTRGGERVGDELVPITWEASDPSVVQIERDGSVRVESVGVARLAADAGGWVADTVRLLSSPVVSVSADPVLRESWRQGIVEGRWTVFGDPAPYVTGAGAGASSVRAFVNNGDANYESGVASVRTVRLDGPSALEIRAALPFDDRHYESLEVGLVPSAPEPGAESWGAGGKIVGLGFGASPRGSYARVVAPGSSWRVPLPAAPGEWHRYVLQIGADGRLSYFVDGRLLWRSPEPAVGPLRDRRLHVLLCGRSLHTELKVDEVTVWDGPLYAFRPGGALAHSSP